MKNRLIGICLLTVIAFVLSGCGFGKNATAKFFNGGAADRSEEIMKTISSAIENGEPQKIKALMAKDAIDGIENCDDKLSSLVDRLQGEVSNLEDRGTEKTTHSRGDEGKCGQPTKKEAVGMYFFLVNNEKYIIKFVDNFQGTTESNTGLYGIKVMKYSAWENGLSSYFNACDYFDIGIIDIDQIKSVEEENKANGIDGFAEIVDDIVRDLEIDSECDDEVMQETFITKVDNSQIKDLKNVIPYKASNNIISIVESGFDIHDSQMYISTLVAVRNKDTNEEFVYRIIWQKTTDGKTGISYLGIMSKNDYDSGKEFPKGEGVFIVK